MLYVCQYSPTCINGQTYSTSRYCIISPSVWLTMGLENVLTDPGRFTYRALLKIQNKSKVISSILSFQEGTYKDEWLWTCLLWTSSSSGLDFIWPQSGRWERSFLGRTWTISLDLIEAYFHIHIHPEFRKFWGSCPDSQSTDSRHYHSGWSLPHTSSHVSQAW